MLKIRKNIGYTRDQVSSICGVNTDTIRKIENGEVIPRFDTLELLSRVYKINLVQVLDRFKSQSNITYFYDLIDYHTSRSDKDELNKVINEFREFCKLFNICSLIDIKELNQLKLFVDALELLYSDKADRYLLSYNLLLKSVGVTLSNFDITRVKDYDYDFFELRILYTISSVLIYLGKYDISIEILKLYLNKMDIISYPKTVEQNILIRVYSLLSYNCHMLNQHENALNYANLGIDFCLKNNNMSNLPLLLSRKGIAILNLSGDDYKYYLMQAIQLLQIQENFKLMSEYIEINKKYGVY